jgi:hypothetical protein
MVNNFFQRFSLAGKKLGPLPVDCVQRAFSSGPPEVRFAAVADHVFHDIVGSVRGRLGEKCLEVHVEEQEIASPAPADDRAHLERLPIR